MTADYYVHSNDTETYNTRYMWTISAVEYPSDNQMLLVFKDGYSDKLTRIVFGKSS